MPRPRVSHLRMIISGNTVEIYIFSKPVGHNLGLKQNNASLNERTKDPKIHPSAVARTKKNVIRLTNANAFQWTDAAGEIIKPSFASLTFKENITDVDFANKEFTSFMKRLNYHYYGVNKSLIKYLTVVEFQERGAVHYHTLFFNLPELDVLQERQTREIKNLWRHGFIDIIPVYSNNVGLYIAKYMTKSIDKRLIGRRRYFASKGLKKPKVFTQEGIIAELLQDITLHELPVHKSTYHSLNTGITTYAVYDLDSDKLQHYFEGYNVDL